jgi:hypothetical protein
LIVLRVQGVRRDEVFRTDQIGQQRVLGRLEELREARLQEGDDVNDPQPFSGVDEEQGGEAEGHGHVRECHRPPAVPAIDEHPGDRAQDDAWDPAGDEHGSGRERRTGEPEDEVGKPDDEDPITSSRDKAGGPQEEEVAPTKKS